MLSVEDAGILSALGSSHTAATRGISQYQGAQTEVLLDQSGSIRFSGSARVQSSGSCTAVGSRTPSLVPRAVTDPLAPFGQELTLWREIVLHDRTWSVPLGVYRITSASDSSERYRGPVAVDWVVDVAFSDRLKMLDDDDFLVPEGPVAGNSVWDEVRRLSPIPVQPALGDASVPAGTVYESRADAVDTLLSLLGGVPHITRQGVLTARVVDRWLTETVPDATITGVIRLSTGMTDDFYNQVATENPNDPLIAASASIREDSNPLSVRRAGGRTYKHSSSVYTTIAAAQAGAQTILARVSTKRARSASVECLPEAILLELGDVARFEDVDQHLWVLGEVSGMRIPLSPTDPVSVDVVIAEQGALG